eukprot:SAG22_NODE_53_length_24242_cov_158.884231_18_plen_193_part_00
MNVLKVADYWSGVEVEAPLDGSTPVEIHGPATIDGILIGPPNSLVNGKPSHYEALIKVDTTASGKSEATTHDRPPLFSLLSHLLLLYAGVWAPAGWHGGKPPAQSCSSGWAVNGLVVDNSNGFGSWDNVIAVDGKGVPAAFNTASTQTIAECLHFGDTIPAKVAVPASSMYVDPETKKLCFKDAGGVVHPLY